MENIMLKIELNKVLELYLSLNRNLIVATKLLGPDAGWVDLLWHVGTCSVH
jgi:hypothetical protein